MSENDFFRLSGLGAIVSAGLSFIGAMVVLLSSLLPQIPDPVVNVLLVVANPFIVLALIGSFGTQQKEIGTRGLVGFVLAVVGILATFLVPLIGHLIFLLGLLLFAIANGQAGTLPNTAIWLWFSGAFTAVAAGVLGLSMLMTLGLIISASGRAWLGAVLWQGRGIQPSAQVSF